MNGLAIGSTKQKPNQELRFKNVSFGWKTASNTIIKQCNFFVPGPGLWMIVGNNGSGKSTLFRLISGLLKAQSGEIRCTYKPALVFQNPDHQLLLPTCGSEVLLNISSKFPISERRAKICDALDQVGLNGMEYRPIHTLSGGQKQRLALASALASQANLLLLDEPTALLDPANQESVLKTVHSLCHRANEPLTALWITHRLAELKYADAATTMKNGALSRWERGEKLMNRLTPLAGRRG